MAHAGQGWKVRASITAEQFKAEGIAVLNIVGSSGDGLLSVQVRRIVPPNFGGAMRFNASVMILLASILATTACGGGYSSSAPSPSSSQGNLNDISVQAASSPSIPVNGTVEVQAYGYYGAQQTSQDLRTSATWSTSNAAVATVDKGHVIGGGVGSATITATFGGKTGSITVVVGLTPTLAIVPSIATLSLTRQQQQFLAQASYSNGTMLDLTVFVTWKSSKETVLAFSVNDPYGLFPGLATLVSVGDTIITATEPTGETGSLALTVNP